MASIPGDQLRTGSGGARLDVGDLAVIDEPKFPMSGPVLPARESFRVGWTATGAERRLRDDGKQFLIQGRPATVAATFSVSVPSLNFSFNGHATATAYAFFGQEVNGYYFDQGAAPSSPHTGEQQGAAMITPSGGVDTGGGGTSGVEDKGLLALGGGAVLLASGAAVAARHHRAEQ